MSGTTRCPYCTTRFKISETQLETHSGMVRCGYCMQTFDARPSFVSAEPSPQLELPMLDTPVSPPPPTLPVLKPMTLAERVAIVDDVGHEDERSVRTWPWTIASLIMLLVMLAQGTYLFRSDLAARLPISKPVLEHYCRLLNCDISLPQYEDLMSIESSGLEAIPDHAGFVTLSALLRNRASYPQAFPNLELTLTDSRDIPLARRTFKPADYLPASENQTIGLYPNRELAIKLHLNTTDLKPMGYRLALNYSGRSKDTID